MGALVKIPVKKSNHSMTEWFNNHFGADVHQAMSGNIVEQKKSERHFNKKTIEARNKYDADS